MKRYFNYAGILTLSLLILCTVSCSDSKTDDKATDQSEKTVTPAVRLEQPQEVKPGGRPRSGPIFKSVSPMESLTMLQERDDVVFLDVRTPRERADASIAGSTRVNFWDLVRGNVALPQEKAILLVCAVGGRSFAAGQILSRKGYAEVYNLEGGIEQWHKDGLPLVRGNTSSGVTMIQ